MGHLETASGVAALIKTALALEHRAACRRACTSPTPNPKLDLANSPFHVNTEAPALADGRRGTRPRRAGVSSFGVGGTNAHAVLEEAPARMPPARHPRVSGSFSCCRRRPGPRSTRRPAISRGISARNRPSTRRTRLSPCNWAVARGTTVGSSSRAVLEDAAGALAGRDARRVFSRADAREGTPVAFPVPGAGERRR